MKDENEVQLAWQIWNLIAKLNDLIWDRYEEQFIDIYLRDEWDKFFNADHHSAIGVQPGSINIDDEK